MIYDRDVCIVCKRPSEGRGKTEGFLFGELESRGWGGGGEDFQKM